MVGGSLAIFLVLNGLVYLGRPVIAGTYDSQLNSVQNQLEELDSNISELKSVAESNGHGEVDQLCENAKAALAIAHSAWKNQIASSFGDQPWLASDSPAKQTVQEHLESCGKSLERVYEHPYIKSEPSGNSSYSAIVESCKATYDGCHSACQSVWNWSPPKPTPSSANYKRQLLARRHLKDAEPKQCPAGETACPISPTSDGFECIDIQTELTSCGGCVSKNSGENCMDIPGAAGVGCKAGKCLVLSVQTGYYLASSGRPALRRRRI